MFPECYTALLVDNPQPTPQGVAVGMVLSNRTEATIAEVGDPHLLVLSHPVERLTLEQAGHTWNSATREGRLVVVRYEICLHCGTRNQRRSLAEPTQGCFTASAVGLAAGIAFGVWSGSIWKAWIASAAALFVATFVHQHAAAAYMRMQFRERAAKVAEPTTCTGCGSARLEKLRTDRTFPCPTCKDMTLSIHVIGMS